MIGLAPARAAVATLVIGAYMALGFAFRLSAEHLAACMSWRGPTSPRLRPPFELAAVMRELVAAPNWAALTICEVNPDHGELDGSTLSTFSRALADVLSGAIRMHD